TTQNQTENNPPKLGNVKIMPEVFRTGDRLYVDVTVSDVDGDDVTVNYEWTLNGEPAGSAREIDAEIKRGDRLSVKITPYDGELYGRTITLKREIGNTPPVIEENKSFVFDGKTYTIQIMASDPDGDDLTYSLKTAPEGMSIDSAGLITWNVPSEFKGKAPVAVSVADGNGGQAEVNFTITITTVID
ncbi:MAG: putative Ig domain-containing protein, partial [Nitrospirota bacterium]